MQKMYIAIGIFVVLILILFGVYFFITTEQEEETGNGEQEEETGNGEQEEETGNDEQEEELTIEEDILQNKMLLGSLPVSNWNNEEDDLTNVYIRNSANDKYCNAKDDGTILCNTTSPRNSFFIKPKDENTIAIREDDTYDKSDRVWCKYDSGRDGRILCNQTEHDKSNLEWKISSTNGKDYTLTNKDRKCEITENDDKITCGLDMNESMFYFEKV